MGVSIQPATPADDSGIRSLLRRQSMPGRIKLAFEREPRFVSDGELTGESSLTFIARDDANGQVVGMASRSVRRAFVNGKPRRIGYLGQLRIDSQYRGRWIVSRGFEQIRKLQSDDPVSFHLASIVEDNEEALGILVKHPRRRFPRFNKVADLQTLAIVVPRRSPKMQGCEVRPATDDRLDDVASFLQTNGARRQFFPYWTADGLRRLESFGLAARDIFIATCNGQLAGVMALWDQRGFKQTVIRSYPVWMRRARPLLNALARTCLPPEGQPLRSAYAALVCLARDDIDVFRKLLCAVLDEARKRSIDHLLVGLDARDPMLQAASKARHISYTSRIYSVEWPDDRSDLEPLDQRPVYVDIAML
jgi:hypothetical protein